MFLCIKDREIQKYTFLCSKRFEDDAEKIQLDQNYKAFIDDDDEDFHRNVYLQKSIFVVDSFYTYIYIYIYIYECMNVYRFVGL